MNRQRTKKEEDRERKKNYDVIATVMGAIVMFVPPYLLYLWEVASYAGRDAGMLAVPVFILTSLLGCAVGCYFLSKGEEPDQHEEGVIQ